MDVSKVLAALAGIITGSLDLSLAVVLKFYEDFTGGEVGSCLTYPVLCSGGDRMISNETALWKLSPAWPRQYKLRALCYIFSLLELLDVNSTADHGQPHLVSTWF